MWLDPADEEMKVDVADRAMLRKLRQTEDQKLLTGEVQGGGCVDLLST